LIGGTGFKYQKQVALEWCEMVMGKVRAPAPRTGGLLQGHRAVAIQCRHGGQFVYAGWQPDAFTVGRGDWPVRPRPVVTLEQSG
jgi:hypothetical protein